MATVTITADDSIRHYADDLAFVAEEAPATDLTALTGHAGTAARNFSLAGINGHEDVQTAASWFHEASLAADDTERGIFLRKADELLYPILWDMTQEYRLMVGDDDAED